MADMPMRAILTSLIGREFIMGNLMLHLKSGDAYSVAKVREVGPEILQIELNTPKKFRNREVLMCPLADVSHIIFSGSDAE